MTAIRKSILDKSNLTRKSDNATYYLEGIRNNDCRVLRKIYDKFLPSVTSFVLNNSGTENEAHDVFQDGLVVIFKKLKKEKLELTASFHTYLLAVCRFIWLRELSKMRRTEVSIDQTQPFIADIDIEEDIENYEKQTFFRSKLESLPDDSKKVLKMFFAKRSLKEIAEEMGYSVEYAKKKKYLAKKMLVEMIQKDKMYHQFS